MDFVPFLVFVAINKKVVDFCKELLPNNLANKVVQLIAWVVGIALSFIFASSVVGDSIDVFGDYTLGNIDLWGVVIYGLAVGSGAGVANDFIERRNPDANPDGT